MATTPIIVQLANGLTEGVSEADAHRPGISYCENLDFSKSGEVSGRPSFVSHTGFGIRSLDTVSGTTTDIGTTPAQLIPYNIASMFKYRDSLGERPGIAANGRMWTWEGDRWADRLYCGASRVERLIDYFTYPGVTTGPGTAVSVAYNYCQADAIAGGIPQRGAQGSPMLGGVNTAIENYQPGCGKFLFGSSCSPRNEITGDVYHCSVGVTLLDNNLRMIVRKNSDQTLSVFSLSAACFAGTNQFASDVPMCCTDDLTTSVYGAPSLWIAFKNVAGNQVNLIRVNAVTGAVTAGPVAIALANVTGMCIASNCINDILVGTFVQNAVAGVACRQFSATTLALNAAANQQLDGASALAITSPASVVCGWYMTGGYAYVAYAKGSVTETTTIIGNYRPGIPSTTILKTLGGTGTGSVWAPAHQPVSIKYNPSGNQAGTVSVERVILGLFYATRGVSNGIADEMATWIGVDLTDMVREGGDFVNGGTQNPGIFAMGPVDGSLYNNIIKPASAIRGTNDSSYRFSTWDFKLFNAFGGTDRALGVYEVTAISPRSASIGEETVLSGSVPRSIARGYAFESVFVQGGPELTASATAGGAIPAGSYSMQACWRYTDAAGVVHRSAPSSIIKTVTTAGANLTITAVIQNCQLHNREDHPIFIELYVTDISPTPTSPKLLRLVQEQVVTPGIATTTMNWTTVVPGGSALYTNSGAILQNLPVSADGGVATVGRRLWVSDGKSVFASKRFRVDTNEGVAWNDEGPLTLKLPSPAGRVFALESLDDKLIVLCEHGIYMTQGDGPEDTGLGQDFLFPVQLSQLGISGERASISTSRGVVFHTKNNTSAGVNGYGGLYILNRGLNIEPISVAAQDEFAEFLASTRYTEIELAYVPERDLLVVNRVKNQTSNNFLVLDMRAGEPPGQWCVWTPANGDSLFGFTGGPMVCCCGVNGALWAVFASSGNRGEPDPAVGCFEGAPGIDGQYFIGDVDQHFVKMLIRTNHIYANGSDGLGWARIRGISTLSNSPVTTQKTYTETLTITQDQTNVLAAGTSTTPAFTTTISGKWPTNRGSIEYRLPNQKCSQIKVELSAVPAVARWSALRLDTIPKPGRAPSNQRV